MHRLCANKTDATQEWRDGVARIARCVERSLYGAAPSLAAYGDLSTLEARLRRLARESRATPARPRSARMAPTLQRPLQDGWRRAADEAVRAATVPTSRPPQQRPQPQHAAVKMEPQTKRQHTIESSTHGQASVETEQRPGGETTTTNLDANITNQLLAPSSSAKDTSESSMAMLRGSQQQQSQQQQQAVQMELQQKMHPHTQPATQERASPGPRQQPDIKTTTTNATAKLANQPLTPPSPSSKETEERTSAVNVQGMQGLQQEHRPQQPQPNQQQLPKQSPARKGAHSDTRRQIDVSATVANAIENTTNNPAPPAPAQSNEREKWANNLVGRWWEVFWEPSASTPTKNTRLHANNKEKEPGGDSREEKKRQPAQQGAPEIVVKKRIKTETSVEALRRVGRAHSLTFQQQQQLHPPSQHCRQPSEQQQQSLPLKLIETRQQNSEPTQLPPNRCLLSLNLQCTTPPPLGFTIRLQKSTIRSQKSVVVVTAVSADSPYVSYVHENDHIVGVNGKRFESALMEDGNLKEVKERLTGKRPIVIMLERWNVDDAVTVDAASMSNASRTSSLPSTVSIRPAAAPLADVSKPKPNGSANLVLNGKTEDIDDVPLSILQKRKGKQQEGGKKEHENDTDSSSEEDDIDWYDAKVIDYYSPTSMSARSNSAAGQFLVHFLGDKESVTYTMDLTPSVVRPSTRAWVKRSLALLQLKNNGGWMVVEGNIKANACNRPFRNFPPSTDLPEDSQNLKEIVQTSNNGTCDAINHELSQYKTLLQNQRYLATRLSAHDNNEEEEGKQDEGENSPGPLADSNFIRRLCHCMEESQKVCEWLIGQTVMLRVLRHINHNTPLNTEAKGKIEDSEGEQRRVQVPKQQILSFLVNGAIFLKSMQACDPHSVPTKQPILQQKRGRGRPAKGGQKRRKTVGSTPCKHDDKQAFDDNANKALVSDAHLENMLDQVLPTRKKPLQLPQQTPNQVPITVFLTFSLTTLFEKLWTPLTQWIHTSEDMINRITKKFTAAQFYTVDQIKMHLQHAEDNNLALVDLSPWTDALKAKLNRARQFEMEAWSAIQASCTQLVMGGSVGVPSAAGSDGGDGVSDDCLLALTRLKYEASSAGMTKADNFHMQNLNPLGKGTFTDAGLIFPSPLTRAVLDDTIVVRQLVLDLDQAKTVRERNSFVQDVVERYTKLPQLPTPPLHVAALRDGGAVANPSATLRANIEDSITLLSSNCFSYNHIIGNIAARLQTSAISSSNVCNSSDAQEAVFLRRKEGVTSALAELARLPILSVVEEKLLVREELIEWSEEAEQCMTSSANGAIDSKKSSKRLLFPQIQTLHTKLTSVLNLQSNRRAKVCQKLRHNSFIEDEVKAFAMADENVVCPITGAWVRDQFGRGSKWITEYSSIINEPSQGSTLDVQRITSLLHEHDDKHFHIAFSDEYAHLQSLQENMTAWTNTTHQIVLSNSLTFQERCDELMGATRQRPNGATDPSDQVIGLWIRAYTWRIKLQRAVGTIAEGIEKQATGAVLAQLIVQGHDLLLAAELRPFLVFVREDTLRSIPKSEAQLPLRQREILESSAVHGKAILDRIIGDETDRKLGSCLLLTRRVFWLMMFRCFFQHLLQDTEFTGNLDDAKALLSLFPHGLGNDALTTVAAAAAVTKATEAAKLRLQKLTHNAEQLEIQASAALNQCTALLQTTNCYPHKEEVRANLLELSEIRSKFDNHHFELAVKLLQGREELKTKLDEKIEGSTWLVGTFAYDILFTPVNKEIDQTCNQIHYANLQDLFNTLPSKKHHDKEIVRVIAVVKDLWSRATAWQTKASIISLSRDKAKDNNCSVVKLDILNTLIKDDILSKVAMPELEFVQNIALLASQLKEKLEEIFKEDNQTTDVNKDHFPDETSLIAFNGNYILHRFTGSDMYLTLQQALDSIERFATQLPITTPEKVTLEWMTAILKWVKSILNAEQYNDRKQLVITIETALEISAQGHRTFHSFEHVQTVQSFLRREKVMLQVSPHNFNVFSQNGGNSLGLGLLRWAALLYRCIKSDLNKHARWKERALEALKCFSTYESAGISDTSFTLASATVLRDNVISLISEAFKLIIHDDEVMCSLSSLLQRMEKSDMFQQCLEAERVAAEEEKFLADKAKFENPQNIIEDADELLDSLGGRLPPHSTDLDTHLMEEFVDSSVFIGEPTVRDKSRFLLTKCLLSGMETLGLDSETDAEDFCSMLAWDLEESVYDMYHTHNSLASATNDYRDKIRSLRFNLQDPKNPMLCARVLAGNMQVKELISATTEDLASNELKLKRQQLEEESIKNVVLSLGVTQKRVPPTGISCELAEKIRIDKTFSETKKAVSQRTSHKPKEELSSQASPPTIPSLEDGSPALVSSSIQCARKDISKTLGSLPPPPMKRTKNQPLHANPFAPQIMSSNGEKPAPPTPLSPVQKYSPSVASPRRSHHILSQSGTDLFQVTISKLKLSFTTKIATDQSCNYELDYFLPSMLVEKGRLNIDQFNSFIHEKTSNGKWVITHLKLSSIEGNTNMSSYKKFYKEYESLGKLTMIQVSETAKIFLVTPKFLRVCKYLSNVKDLSKSCTYVVVLTKDQLERKPTDIH